MDLFHLICNQITDIMHSFEPKFSSPYEGISPYNYSNITTKKRENKIKKYKKTEKAKWEDEHKEGRYMYIYCIRRVPVTKRLYRNRLLLALAVKALQLEASPAGKERKQKDKKKEDGLYLKHV